MKKHGVVSIRDIEKTSDVFFRNYSQFIANISSPIVFPVETNNGLDRLSFMQGSRMIRKISIMVIDGLPWQLREHALPGTTWIRFNAKQPELDAIYVRIHPLEDVRDWWMVVRLCGEPHCHGEFLGRPAKMVVSYRPQHGKTLTQKEYFNILDNGIEEYWNKHGTIFPFVLNWAVAMMGDDCKRERCVSIVQVSDFFAGDLPSCLVRVADCKEEYKEAAVLVDEYDYLYVDSTLQKEFIKVMRGDGCLLVAYPMRDSHEERLPIIGCIAFKAQRKANASFTVTMFFLAVNPQFRRSGIGTLLLDGARQIYPNSNFMALVPLADGYNEMLLFLKQYGSTSKVLDVSTGKFEVVEFNIPSWSHNSSLGIVGLSEAPP